MINIDRALIVIIILLKEIKPNIGIKNISDIKQVLNINMGKE